MGKGNRKLLWSLGCGVLLVLNGFTAAGYYFYHVAIKRNKKLFLQNNKDLKPNPDLAESMKEACTEKATKEVPCGGMDWVEQQPFETYTILSEDGLKLVGYYLSAKDPTTKMVILAHGYVSYAKEMGDFARFYHEKLGYHVLMPDARGHGASEGDYIGFGWHERRDYISWIQWAISHIGINVQIALHGISMGAATVMMVSGEELPGQVKAIVEDCGYTTVRDELSYQLKRMYHLPPFPIMSFTSVITNFKAGYRFSEASALGQVKKNRIPMLFIHGDEDTFVPTGMVYRLYEACEAEKELLIVEGAGHGLAYTVKPEDYEMKTKEFLDKYIKNGE
jgi:fermentation-respiration switch protein FrsA (DUF1100 family)